MTRNMNERGQVLPVVAMLLVVLIGMVGLAVDVGRLYVAKAELSRALDSAALAGVLELPNTTAAEARADAYLLEHVPDANATYPSTSDSGLRVQATRNVNLVFMGILGFTDMDVTASAAAGFDNVSSDTVMILDATSSMGDSPCNSSQNNNGCPIKEAKAAADGFVDALLSSGNALSKVGYSPYRGCYNPPNSTAGCVPASMTVGLTTNAGTLHTGISNTRAQGGTGTNVCLGLWQAQQMYASVAAQPGSNVTRSVVILTDGDNNYNPVANSSALPAACRPATATGSDGTSGCDSAGTRERDLDRKTVTLVNQLKAQGVQVYVVAFGACGSSNATTPSASYCANVGNADHDNTADRRLLKCIASSSAGTNDHYFEVPSATDLPQVFQQIARAIGFRLTE